MHAKDARHYVEQLTRSSLIPLFRDIKDLATQGKSIIKDVRLTERQKIYLIRILGYTVNIQEPLGPVTLYKVEW